MAGIAVKLGGEGTMSLAELKRNTVLILTGVFVLMTQVAATPASAVKDAALHAEARDAITRKLTAAVAGAKILSIEPSPIAGLYEVNVGGETVYVAADGGHMIGGDMYQIGPQLVNVSESKRTLARRRLLAEIDESEMVVFSPPPRKVKAKVTVFTDIDCGYCRKLHREIKDYNDLGIAIRYMAFPRAGLESRSYQKAVSTWCSDDPNAAMTQAKSGVDLERRVCANPVSTQYRLGEMVGVTGTPALVLEDGSMLMGYRPPVELARTLGIEPP